MSVPGVGLRTGTGRSEAAVGWSVAYVFHTSGTDRLVKRLLGQTITKARPMMFLIGTGP